MHLLDGLSTGPRTSRKNSEVCPGCIGFSMDQTHWNRQSGYCCRFEDVQERANAGCKLCRLLRCAIKDISPFGEKTVWEDCYINLQNNHVGDICVGGLRLRDERRASDGQGLVKHLELYLQESTLSHDQRRKPPRNRWSAVRRTSKDLGFGLVPVQSDIFASSDSAAAFSLVSAWYQTCLTHHSKCHNDRPTPLPTRVLDVQCGVLLYEPPSRKIASYAALSYCWGGTQPLVTDNSSLACHKHGIPWPTLPRLFQDTIVVVRKLGMRYLWIDALCIVQDDREDWEIEAASMHETYRNANLVITATSAPNPNTPLFSKRTSHLSKTYVLPAKSLSEHEMPIRVRESVAKSELARADDPVSRRAWTFQERVVSRRRLFYSTKELVWECTAAFGSESKGTPLSPLETSRDQEWTRDILAQFYRYPYPTWLQIIEAYSQRSLTKQTDRLPALSAVASLVSHKDGGAYLAGLWRKDIARCLAWYSLPESANSTVLPSSAPTWSWVSVSGGVSYSCPATDKPTHTRSLTVIEAHCPPVGKNPYGEVKDGFIIISGTACRAILNVTSASISLKAYSSSDQQRITSGMNDTSIWLDGGLMQWKTGSAHDDLSRWLTRSPGTARRSEAPIEGMVLLLLLYRTKRFSGLEKRRKWSFNNLVTGSWADTMVRDWSVFLLIGPSTSLRSAFERLGLLRVDNESWPARPSYLQPAQLILV